MGSKTKSLFANLVVIDPGKIDEIFQKGFRMANEPFERRLPE